MYLLTIIIPVYNIESYLKRCLDSILHNQDVPLEVLLINDGSTDSSGDICEDYATKDDRVRVLHQKNKGVSVARNVGIQNAKGDFICFIDGDDWIESHSLEKMLKNATPDCDILIAKSFLNNGKSLGDQQFAFNFEYKNKIFTGIELMLNHGYLGGAAWGALYSKKLLFANKVLFPEGIKNGEDSIFAALCQIYSKKVIFLDLHFYNVFERDGSASRSWSFDRLALMPNNLKFINDYKSSHPNLSTEALNILDYRMFAFIRHMFNLFYKMFNIRNYMILRGKIKKELKSKLNIGKIRHHKNQVKLLNFSLDFFAFAVFFNNLFFKKNY